MPPALIASSSRPARLAGPMAHVAPRVRLALPGLPRRWRKRSLPGPGGGGVGGRRSFLGIVVRPRPLRIVALATALLGAISLGCGLAIAWPDGPTRWAVILAVGFGVAVGAGLLVARRERQRARAAAAALASMTAERDRIAADLARSTSSDGPARGAGDGLARRAGDRPAPAGERRPGSDPYRAAGGHAAERHRLAGEPRRAARHATTDAAASIAHELSGPLTRIAARAELTLEELLPEDRARPILESIRDDAFRAATIARAMLARSRGEEPATRLFDIGGLVLSVTEWHRTAVGNPVIRFESSVIPRASAPCGDGRSATSVVADPLAVEQILDNLVANAVAALPHGGTVRVLVSAGPEVVEVRVIDDGIGMSASTLERAFEPHFTTRGSAGTGLGLTISRSLAESHGGSLTAASAPGRGTTMTLRLPSAAAPFSRAA